MRLATLLVALLTSASVATATLTDPAQNDAGQPGDAGDDRASARRLGGAAGGADGSYGGLVVRADDDADWYTFPLKAGTHVTVQISLKGLACTPDALVTTPMEVRLETPSTRPPDVRYVPDPCSADAKSIQLHGRADVPGFAFVAIQYLRSDGRPGLALDLEVPPPQASLTTGYVASVGCDPYC